jgi:hypothetical protein
MDPGEDIDLLAAAFIGLVERLFEMMRTRGEPLGDEPRAVVKHEYPGRRRRAPAQADQNDLSIKERRYGGCP